MYTHNRMDIQDKKNRHEMGSNCVCFNLRRAARLVTQRYERALKKCGVKATQFSVLVTARNNDSIPLTKMARLLGMDRTSLTRTLNIMIEKGLVTVKTGDDKRGRQISITPTGIKVLEDAVVIWRNVQTEVVENLGQEKWASLLSGLRELSKRA